jgi:hypothetical protein
VYDPRSRGAESYIRLAKEIIERQGAAGLQISELVPETSGLASQTSQLATDGTEEHRGEQADQEVSATTPEMDKTA